MAPRANWKGFLRLSLVTCPEGDGQAAAQIGLVLVVASALFPKSAARGEQLTYLLRGQLRKATRKSILLTKPRQTGSI
jgi:hypothetical protein